MESSEYQTILACGKPSWAIHKKEWNMCVWKRNSQIMPLNILMLTQSAFDFEKTDHTLPHFLVAM